MFLFYTMSYSQVDDGNGYPFFKGYEVDTFNLYIISKKFPKFPKFPKFFNEIKHINLDRPGVNYDLYIKKLTNESKWYTVLYWMNIYSDYGIFHGRYNEVYSFDYEHPVVMINNMKDNNSTSPSSSFIISLIIYIENKYRFPKNIQLNTLFYLFSFNTDMYNDIIKRVNIHDLPNPYNRDYNLLIRADQDTILPLFIEDIKTRLK